MVCVLDEPKAIPVLYPALMGFWCGKSEVQQ
jgi:hypothetical protein